MANDPLDEYFDSTSRRVHSSPRKLANIVRAAYPIGVPALIMKSSTDRFGEAAGYSFHLGTPDENLRRIASWLLTNAGGDQKVLVKLIRRLWKRHGRRTLPLQPYFWQILTTKVWEQILGLCWLRIFLEKSLLRLCY